jgi:hypothetical protein
MGRVFTARYALSPYIKQIRFIFKGLITALDGVCVHNPIIFTLTSTEFLGLIIDDNLSWKNRIDHFMSKLNSACFAVRTVKPIMSQKALRIIYFLYVHSIITYGTIFWGNLPYSINIFRIQRKIIRIIKNSRNRDSCRELFKKLKKLPLCSQVYILSIIVRSK